MLHVSTEYFRDISSYNRWMGWIYIKYIYARLVNIRSSILLIGMIQICRILADRMTSATLSISRLTLMMPSIHIRTLSTFLLQSTGIYPAAKILSTISGLLERTIHIMSSSIQNRKHIGLHSGLKGSESGNTNIQH